MARKKRPSRVRPKTPARVKKRQRTRRIRSHHHPELVGLGLLAAGVFLGTLLWLGWDGGVVGVTRCGDSRVSIASSGYGARPLLAVS
jgi:hypothetical protein